MLVLTRKQAERIVIGDNIAITVVRIDGNKVRIGIDAPADVAIQRGELTLELEAAAAPVKLAVGQGRSVNATC